MSGKSREWRRGKRSHTMHVERAAEQLVSLRQDIVNVDWAGRQGELQDKLGLGAVVGAELLGRSTRMDRDGDSRRAACELRMGQAAARASVLDSWVAEASQAVEGTRGVYE